MTDTEALRQALDWASKTGHRMRHPIIHAAARRWLALAEGGEKIWWCEKHKAADAFWPPEESLEESPSGFCMFVVGCDDGLDYGCHIVSRILAAITEEEK